MSLEVKLDKTRRRRLWHEIQQTDYSGIHMQNNKLEQNLRRYKKKLQLAREHSSLLIEQDVTSLKREVTSMQAILASSGRFRYLERPFTTPMVTENRRNTSTLPMIRADPSKFPPEWFKSVYDPCENRIKRRSKSNFPIPTVKRKGKTQTEKEGLKTAPERHNKDDDAQSKEDQSSVAKNCDDRRDSSVRKLPPLELVSLPVTKEVDATPPATATHHSRSVRELKEMSLIDKLADRVPNTREIRKQKMLERSHNRCSKAIERMNTFIVTLERERLIPPTQGEGDTDT